jgi:hypothetical protein
MTNWGLSIISLIGAAATIFMPQLQHIVSTHPAVAGAVGAAYAILAHLAPSPLSGAANE